MRKYRLCLLVILIAFCIQGCSKQQDVEDHSFVLAMGFERLNEKKVLVRYSYADFDKAQSDSGTKIPSRSVTFLATSLKDANKKWKQYKSQQLNFGHLKVVLFANGKKDEKIIKELVNEPQIAKSVYVLKTDRNLSDIFKKEDDRRAGRSQKKRKSGAQGRISNCIHLHSSFVMLDAFNFISSL